MEKIILEAVSKVMKDKKMSGSSLWGFMKGKSCLNHLLVFYCKITDLVERMLC